MPIFLIYFVLSINKAANPNWDGLAFLSLGILAASYWREKLESRPKMRRWAGGAARPRVADEPARAEQRPSPECRFPFPRRDPADRMRGWKTAAAAVEKMRGEIEAELGERVFMIADGRDRASEFAFYFRDKRVKVRGIRRSTSSNRRQSLNQFSFWPRYDEFVAAPPGRTLPEGDVYTEEDGVNLFEGRTAMYIQGNNKAGSGAEHSRGVCHGRSSRDDRNRALREGDSHLAGLRLPNYRTLPL